MKQKTLLTIGGVLILFFIRLCTQTSEARPDAPTAPTCDCPGCRPDIHGTAPCLCPPCERHLPALTHDVPACMRTQE